MARVERRCIAQHQRTTRGGSSGRAAATARALLRRGRRPRSASVVGRHLKVSGWAASWPGPAGAHRASSAPAGQCGVTSAARGGSGRRPVMAAGAEAGRRLRAAAAGPQQPRGPRPGPVEPAGRWRPLVAAAGGARTRRRPLQRG